MSFSHFLSDPTRGVYYPLSSRASSATLFLSQQVPHCHVDGATDLVDISIAEGLLQTESPRVPQRRSSFNHSATARQSRFPRDNSKQQVDARPSGNRHLRQGISSNTWTSSSGEGSQDGGNDDRTPFVSEYNKLAKKYGVQTIVPDEFIAVHVDKLIITTKPGRWILRKLLRRTSSVQVSRQKAEKHIRHKRSISDISLRLRPKKDTLVGKELEELIRLCGASPLYLPVEYAAGTLAVPTCFRATAQYLVQHAATSRGIFRIPGSHSAINALYNHYASQDGDGGVINGTVRCPTLPEHIQCGVHDVASAFKKFLAGLPGGILGKAWLFNAFVSIYTQLDAKAEFMRTKQSKVRARLIALAIAAVAPRYQRELICAVLGLLSMIGRAAETAPREDEHGRPLPTSDLMGYEALGIVFGPLLIGNLLESHDLCPTGPHGSSMFIQRSPPKSSRGKHNKNKSGDDSITLLQGTDKIRIINSITEMLINHWRDVVRHMKNMGALKTMTQHHGFTRADTSGLATPLLPELFAIRRPCDWDMDESSLRHVDRSRSPTPSSRNGQVNMLRSLHHNNTSTPQDDMLSVRKRRPRPMSSQILSGAKSMSMLAPTIEETPVKQEYEQPIPESVLHITQNAVHFHERGGVKAKQSTQTFHKAYLEPVDKSKLEQPIAEKRETVSQTVRQDLISTELNKSIDKEASRDDQTELKDIRRVAHGRCLSEENTKLPSIKAYQAVFNQISMPPLNDTQKQSEGLSKQLIATSPPLGSSNDIRNQPEAFSQVPSGIVSIHLRRIAASDPGPDPPSWFAGILKTDHRGKFPQKRRPNTATGASLTFEHFPKDPLSKVSREEDIASLESLAEIIQSQDESICIDSVQSLDLVTRPDTPVNVVKSRTRRTIPVAFTTEHQSIESLSKPGHRKTLPEDPVLVLKTDLPTDTKTLPMTPRRSATESSVGHRSGGGSVRALAARFGNVGMNARQTPSPVHTPHPRVWHGSLVEKAVVAPYTVNTSPVPMAQKLTRSDVSLQSIRNPIQVKIRTVASSSRFQRTASPNQPKPLYSSSYLNHDSSPPLWPTLRPVNRSPRQNSDIVQVGRNSLTLPPFSSILHRTGDGYVSFALSRKSSLGTILPRPDEPQERYVDFAHPTAMHSDHYSSPLENSTSSSFANNGLSSYSVGSQHTKIQSTSILYTQIQYLSKQLRSKAEEADNLRRQLETKDSLNDLGTLNEQLKQAKRDLTVWRGRAEVAEKRIKMLSQISQKEADEEVVDESFDTDLSVTGERSLTDEEARSKTQIRNELHEFDGISTGRILLGSEGTIRHTSPMQRYGSEIELNIA